MIKVTGGRLFAKALKQEGVEQIFTLSGGHIMPIYYGCRDEGIKVIHVRHEATAVFAADAYARATGRPGVAVTTAGPGIANSSSAMAEAYCHGTPLIHIGGAPALSLLDSGEEQDIIRCVCPNMSLWLTGTLLRLQRALCSWTWGRISCSRNLIWKM